jgi:hypothetical protein
VYHPTSLPDFDMKCEDHKHFDEWHDIFYGEEDKYEFQYQNCDIDIQDNGGTQLVLQAESSPYFP